jgi:hypothetical protein
LLVSIEIAVVGTVLFYIFYIAFAVVVAATVAVAAVIFTAVVVVGHLKVFQL